MSGMRKFTLDEVAQSDTATPGCACRTLALTSCALDESPERLLQTSALHLLPVQGHPAQLDVAARLLSKVVSVNVDVAPTLTFLNNRGGILQESWASLGEIACSTGETRLARQLIAAQVLPEQAGVDVLAWYRSQVSVDDVSRDVSVGMMPLAVEDLAVALANDARGIDELLGRSHEIFRDLADMLKAAVSHLGNKDRMAIENIKEQLQQEMTALESDDGRYVLFGGLVSAGKTTLVNAFLLLLIPELHEELKADKSGKINLMPTSFNENTRIVTELKLCPQARAIEVCLFQSADAGLDFPMKTDDDIEDLDAQTPARDRRVDIPKGFVIATGFPQTFSPPKGWRGLQRLVRQICQQQPPDLVMRRLQIILPCKDARLQRSLSIIDTPGLDSPTVWRQIQELVHSKAFVFAWVGSLDAATALGLQGRRLVELYRSAGHPLPPLLVLTKWDRLKLLPEFREPRALAAQARHRLRQLRSGLLAAGQRHRVLATASDLASLAAGLEGDGAWEVVFKGHVRVRRTASSDGQPLGMMPTGAVLEGRREGNWLRLAHDCGFMMISQADGVPLLRQQPQGCGQLDWPLLRPVEVGRHRFAKGTRIRLPTACSSSGEAACALQVLPLPALIDVHPEDVEKGLLIGPTPAEDALLLLASTNATAVVEQDVAFADSEERRSARADLDALWTAIHPLLNGLSEPMRISKRLSKITVATQRVINVLLKDDRGSMVFEHSRSRLDETQRAVVANFTQRVEQYFTGFPVIVRNPAYVPAGCIPEVSLDSYKPPPGLEAAECATSLISKFVKDAHEEAKMEKSQFKYVKTVATLAIRAWQMAFLQNMICLERACAEPLQRQVHELMCAHGLVTHADWETSLRDLIASPIEAVGLGLLSGAMVGGYCGFLAQALGAGLGVGLGLGVLVAAGVTAVCLEDSALARNFGVWSFEEAQARAAQTVLDVLNNPEFQAKATRAVIGEFQGRVQACLDELIAMRIPAASDAPEAKRVRSIQLKIHALHSALSQWFSAYVAQQVDRDPWLVPPPADLRAALRDDVSQSRLYRSEKSGSDGSSDCDGSSSQDFDE